MKPQFKTATDITNLEGFIGAISKDCTELSRILYHYDIRPHRIKCALCGTLHMDGRIIELKGGDVSNIGHECGRKYFADSYRDALNSFVDENSVQQLRRRVASGIEALNTIRMSFIALENRAFRLRQLHSRFTTLFPTLAVALRRRAIENTSQVNESVMRPKAEIDNLMAANPHQKRELLAFKEIPRGTVTGYRFGQVDWSPSGGTYKLLSEINTFCDLSLAGLKLSPLKHHAMWLDEFDENLRKTRLALDDGEAFFTSDNFKVFAYLTHDSDQKRRLEELKPSDLMAVPMSVTPARQAIMPSGVIRAQRREPPLSAKQMRRLLADKKAR